MKECPKCKTMLEDDEMFCHECGTKQEIEEVAAQNEDTSAPLEKRCIYCGETIDEDSAFCPYCGKSQTVEEDVKEVEPEQRVEEPQPEEEPVQKTEPKMTPAQEAPGEQTTYEVEEETKSKAWIWILLAALILGGAGWYYFSGNSDYNQDYNETSSVADNPTEEGIVSRMKEILSQGMKMSDEDAVFSYFSQEFREEFRKVEIYDKENLSDGEIGFWDFSVWGDGQGDMGDFHIEIMNVRNVKELTADVTVRFISDSYEDYKKDIQYHLVFENDDWLIDEVTDFNAYSYKKAMKEYLSNENSNKEDITSDGKTQFINEMYKDFFANQNFNTEDAGNLRKYLSDNIIEKLLMECPYDGCEGEKRYGVDCFVDGSLSYERPDYGNSVVKRNIRQMEDDWYEVINYWDVVETPVKVLLKVSESGDNNFKITDFKMPTD